MLPHYIVDGYNVIHTIPTLKKLLAHDGFQAREHEIMMHIANPRRLHEQ